MCQGPVLVHEGQDRRPLLADSFETCNLPFVSLEQRIAVHIGKGGRELEHLVLREVESVPQFLQLVTRVLDK
ncbi:hypothetical protein HYQ46_005379 [Verticillium longisporum]|nr:hypothetical protein HYQ46_005379 [Verticillium longisporum]